MSAVPTPAGPPTAAAAISIHTSSIDLMFEGWVLAVSFATNMSKKGVDILVIAGDNDYHYYYCVWLQGLESNQQPPVYESGALPLSYPAKWET